MWTMEWRSKEKKTVLYEPGLDCLRAPEAPVGSIVPDRLVGESPFGG